MAYTSIRVVLQQSNLQADELKKIGVEGMEMDLVVAPEIGEIGVHPAFWSWEIKLDVLALLRFE